MTVKKAILIIVIFLLIGGGAVYYFWNQSNLARGLTLELKAPEEKILLGVPFTLVVDVGNDSQSLLQDVKLTVNLPEGMVFAGRPPENNVDNIKTLNEFSNFLQALITSNDRMKSDISRDILDSVKDIKTHIDERLRSIKYIKTDE